MAHSKEPAESASLMNLSGRNTAYRTNQELVDHGFHYFQMDAVEQKPWNLGGIEMGRVASLSFNPESNAATFKATLLPGRRLPAGTFNADLEIFVISGAVGVGDFVLKKHGYMFVPAGVHLGAVELIAPELGQAGAQLLWMQNGGGADHTFAHTVGDEHTSAGAARLSEFVPPLDASYIGWSQATTAQFTVSKKKWLRRAGN